MSDWDAAIASWSAHVARARSEHTAKSYVNHVRALAVDVGDLAPWQVTSGTLEEYLRRQNWSRGTRAKVLVSLRAFYAWAMDEGLVSRSPLGRRDGRPPQVGSEPGLPEVAGLGASGRRPPGVAARRRSLRRHDQRAPLSPVRLAELYADPWQVTGDDLALWLARVDLAPETRRSMRSSVTGFYRWAVESGRAEVDPSRQLQPIMRPRALPRPHHPDALSRALSDADDRQRLIPHARSRGGPAAGRDRSRALPRPDRRAAAGEGQGRPPEAGAAPPGAAGRAGPGADPAYRGRCGSGWSGPYVTPNGWLFPSSCRPEPLTAKWIGQIAQGCLPAGWTLHTLRHRFASQAYAVQRDLRAVQELLGHAKPETTARYAVVPDGARLAAVLGAGI